jgi:hypothetical protein
MGRHTHFRGDKLIHNEAVIPQPGNRGQIYIRVIAEVALHLEENAFTYNFKPWHFLLNDEIIIQ